MFNLALTEVDYFGNKVMVHKGYKYIATDNTGDVYAYSVPVRLYDGLWLEVYADKAPDWPPLFLGSFDKDFDFINSLLNIE